MGASIRAETGPAMRNPSNAAVLRGCPGCPDATQFAPCGTSRASLSSSCYSALPSWPSWPAWPCPAFARACELRRFAPPPTSCWRVCSKPAAVPSSSRMPGMLCPSDSAGNCLPAATAGAFWRWSIEAPGQRARARGPRPARGSRGAVVTFAHSFLAECGERQQRHPNYLRPAGNRATARHRHQRERPRSNLGGGGGGMPLIRRPLRARGFSMLEVLLALAVLSVGLLGAAAMLLDSLRTHGGALRRLGATQLARDMADRIRANPRARALYDSRSALRRRHGLRRAQWLRRHAAGRPRSRAFRIRRACAVCTPGLHSERGIRARHRPRRTRPLRDLPALARCARCHGRHRRRGTAGAGAVAGGGLSRARFGGRVASICPSS